MNAPAFSAAIPATDPDAIRTFCDIVFGGLDGLVPVRLLAEKGIATARPRLPFVAVDGLAEAIASLASGATKEGRGVFVVPGTVARAGSARAGDVVQSAVILVDLDAGDIDAKLAHLEDHLGPASLVVASGGRTDDGQDKRHAYWRLYEPVKQDGLKRLAALRATLAEKVGGDPAFGSLHQPIRVAGTIHGKHGVLTPVRVIAARTNAVPLEDMAVAIDRMPILQGMSPRIDVGGRRHRGPSAKELALKRIHAGGTDELTRFDALGKVIGHWLRLVRTGRVTLAEAWLRVQEHNAACISPPWEDHRLENGFKRLLSRDEANYGPMPDFGLHALGLSGSDGAASDEGNGASPTSAAPETVQFSDDDLALRFAERFRDRIRYAPARKLWMVWTGIIWRPDETRVIVDLVRKSLRIDASLLDDVAARRRLCSDRTITAVEKLARADRTLATAEADWDRDVMSINTPAGVLDLVTGEMSPHVSGQLLTRVAGASPGGACQTWERFIAVVTGEDPDLAAYLQRVAGYCLTGSMAEQVFFFLCGSGANGKSVFISMLSHVLGGYAATAALDTFTSSTGDRHPTDLAGIARARAVFVTETEHGKAWAEGRIKAITGGDRLRVRFLYRDFFEVDPAFKIMVAGNTRPQLTGVGEAMRRRLHLVPFSVTIPPEARDRTLLDRLKGETDGVFRWMMEGCKAWQQIGLAPPVRVTEEAQSYFRDEDVVGQWLDEACIRAPDQQALSLVLYTSWREWAEARGLPPWSQRWLGEELRTRGFLAGRVHKGRIWIGVAPRGCPPGGAS